MKLSEQIKITPEQDLQPTTSGVKSQTQALIQETRRNSASATRIEAVPAYDKSATKFKMEVIPKLKEFLEKGLNVAEKSGISREDIKKLREALSNNSSIDKDTISRGTRRQLNGVIDLINDISSLGGFAVERADESRVNFGLASGFRSIGAIERTDTDNAKVRHPALMDCLLKFLDRGMDADLKSIPSTHYMGAGSWSLNKTFDHERHFFGSVRKGNVQSFKGISDMTFEQFSNVTRETSRLLRDRTNRNILG